VHQISNIFFRYGVSNIRELLGHKVDLNFIETNPAVRLEKE
jgi:phenylalanyl-tRNA synthetase alpha chain